MTPNDLIAYYGTQTAAAEALGTRQSTVSDWCRAGHVPYHWQMLAEEVTAGALRADRDAWRLEIRPRGTAAPVSSSGA